MRKATFAAIEAIATTLPDVEVATAWGSPALRVRGRMFGCIAVHKSAEPNSLMLRMDVGQRDALIEEEPGTYYVTQHYEPYPCVLVRLSRVSPDALRDLVHAAYRFIEPSAKKPSGSVRRRVSRARKGPRVK